MNLASKIAKIYELHAGVPSSGAPFILRGGTNKKTHFKSHVLASLVQLPTTKKVGLAFDQSRVSTKCPQEGNNVKLST